METQPEQAAANKNITSDVPKTTPKIKNSGGVASGKRLAEMNKQARKAKYQQASAPKSKEPDTSKEEKLDSNNSVYYILGFGTLIVSGLGVYYQREAILNAIGHNQQQTPTPAPPKPAPEPAPAPEPEPEPKPAPPAPKKKYCIRKME